MYNGLIIYHAGRNTEHSWNLLLNLNMSKIYHMGEVTIEALRDASFEIEKARSASSSVHPVRARPHC